MDNRSKQIRSCPEGCTNPIKITGSQSDAPADYEAGGIDEHLEGRKAPSNVLGGLHDKRLGPFLSRGRGREDRDGIDVVSDYGRMAGDGSAGGDVLKAETRRATLKRHPPDVTRQAPCPCDQAPIEHDTSTNPGRDREEDEIRALSGPEAMLAPGGRLRVVNGHDGNAKPTSKL